MSQNQKIDLNVNQNTSITQELEFINSLVQAILGYSLIDIEESQREIVTKRCVQIFSDYITGYVEEKYGRTEALRIKAVQAYKDPGIFEKFKQLGPIFEEAYNSFLMFLEADWNSRKV